MTIFNAKGERKMEKRILLTLIIALMLIVSGCDYRDGSITALNGAEADMAEPVDVTSSGTPTPTPTVKKADNKVAKKTPTPFPTPTPTERPLYDGTVRDANGNIIYNEVLAGEGPKFAGEYHDESNTMTMTMKIHGTDEFTYDVEIKGNRDIGDGAYSTWNMTCRLDSIDSMSYSSSTHHTSGSFTRDKNRNIHWDDSGSDDIIFIEDTYWAGTYKSTSTDQYLEIVPTQNGYYNATVKQTIPGAHGCWWYEIECIPDTSTEMSYTKGIQHNFLDSSGTPASSTPFTGDGMFVITHTDTIQWSQSGMNDTFVRTNETYPGIKELAPQPNYDNEEDTYVYNDPNIESNTSGTSDYTKLEMRWCGTYSTVDRNGFANSYMSIASNGDGTLTATITSSESGSQNFVVCMICKESGNGSTSSLSYDKVSTIEGYYPYSSHGSFSIHSKGYVYLNDGYGGYANFVNLDYHENAYNTSPFDKQIF